MGIIVTNGEHNTKMEQQCDPVCEYKQHSDRVMKMTQQVKLIGTELCKLLYNWEDVCRTILCVNALKQQCTVYIFLQLVFFHYLVFVYTGDIGTSEEFIRCITFIRFFKKYIQRYRSTNIKKAEH